MRVDGIDWTLIRSFLAVIDGGSLNAAAKRLRVQQPTLSRHITELEAQLGASLFERTARGLVPTAAGTAIVDAARQMAAAAHTLQICLQGMTSSAVGTVRISASEVFAAYFLPDFIADFVGNNIEIQVELVVSNDMSDLLRRDADIAIRLLRPAQSGLIAKKLGDLPLGLFASADYLAQCGTPKTHSDLTRHRIIGLDYDDSLIRGAQSIGLDLARENFIVRCDNQIIGINLVQAGAGIGVIPLAIGKKLSRLVQLFPNDEIMSFPVWLVVHREIQDRPAIRKIYDFLSDKLASALKV
jgi:DNA-binding transcriptional LysR family regulator